ncbi:MAG: gliding motility-associated C-terminal domain-containing protein [Bacteroidetes bacterium]|nr:gliding motility-associated C-terminal domain-containing protein [Bacteroidota bacterium]
MILFVWNASTSLTAAGVPPTGGPFTYSWSPASGGITNPTSATTDVRPTATTTYSVTMVSQAQCMVTDSFQVVVQGIGPKLIVFPSDNYVCPGASVVLNPIVGLVNCGAVSDPQNPCMANSKVISKDLGTATTSTSTNTTPYTGQTDGRFQYLYQGYELQSLGMGAGAITSLGFNVATKNSVRPFGSFTIKLACTPLKSLVAGSYVTASFVTVLNPMTYSTTAGWNIHTFDTPYNWDGFSNLLVEICYDTSVSTSADPVFYSQSTELNSVRYGTATLTTSSGCTNINAQGTVGRNRPNTRFGMCVSPINQLSYTWTGSDGTILPDTSNPTAVVNYNVTYHVKVSDGLCSGDTTIQLFIDTSLAMTAGPDTVVCNTDSIELRARFIHPPVTSCIPGYIVTPIPYSPITPPGSTTAGPVGDDVVSPVKTLPFSFSFFCSTVTQYYISTNGFITFSSGQGAGCCLGQSLPAAASPNNVIALCWSDMNTNLGGTIDYFTTGSAPNRVVVIRWNNVRFVTGIGALSGEMQIYEGTNVIEMHIFSQTSSGMTNTLGVENTTGTVGNSPVGYNASSWTTSSPIAFRFTPQSTANSLISSILWTPSSGLSDPTILNPKAFPGTPTEYSFVATLNNGCVMRDTIKVSIGDFPYTIGVSPDSTCPGDTSQIIFNGTGASFRWIPSANISSDTAQSPFVWPTTSTTYRLTAFSPIGCRVNDTIRIKIIERGPVTLGRDTSICPYDTVQLTPSGSPYSSYQWSTGDTVPSISTAPQVPNVKGYWVRVFDGKCFYNSDTVTVSKYILSPAMVTPAGDTSFCLGSSIELIGSSGFVIYKWNNGGTTQNINVSTSGVYTYTATDNRGCIVKAMDTASVRALPAPSPEITAMPNAICVGQGSSVLRVNIESGATYTWTPGNTQADSLVISTPGDYSVAASKDGCTSRDTITIIANNPPVVNLGDDINLCHCDTAVTLASGANGTYLWSNDSTASSISVSKTGSYSLTVTDQFNCTGTDAIEIGIRCLVVDAVVSDPASGTVFSGRDATLDVAATSYTGTFNYSWSPSTYLVDSTEKSPYVKAPLVTTTYTVMVLDEEFGCVAYDTVLLTVIPPGVPPMPDAFTPNGDGMNDTYGPVIPKHLEEVYTIESMKIYNRWGQLIYDGNGYWDGTFKGAEQPVGTYIYYIKMLGPDQNNSGINIQHHDSGSFTLLR